LTKVAEEEETYSKCRSLSVRCLGLPRSKRQRKETNKTASDKEEGVESDDELEASSSSSLQLARIRPSPPSRKPQQRSSSFLLLLLRTSRCFPIPDLPFATEMQPSRHLLFLENTSIQASQMLMLAKPKPTSREGLRQREGTLGGTACAAGR
jgi:hypothetical protein